MVLNISSKFLLPSLPFTGVTCLFSYLNKKLGSPLARYCLQQMINTITSEHLLPTAFISKWVFFTLEVWRCIQQLSSYFLPQSHPIVSCGTSRLHEQMDECKTRALCTAHAASLALTFTTTFLRQRPGEPCCKKMRFQLASPSLRTLLLYGSARNTCKHKSIL